MEGTPRYRFRIAVLILVVLISVAVSLTLFQDRVEADFRNSSYYLSESFLFSSFWWLFLPFILIQFFVVKSTKTKNVLLIILLIVLPIAFHILAYPAFVWVVSKLFYEHAFRFNQTLQYGLITHLVELILIYSIPLLAFVSFGRRTPGKIGTTNQSSKEERTPPSFMVTEGNKRLKIELADIHYIMANSPYSTIFCDDKKYLYNGSLKSVVGKVSGFGFVRIHKSTIVNIQFVHSYASRLNGDYDVTMKNGSTLRISRNYAAAFKAEFQQPHQDTTK